MVTVDAVERVRLSPARKAGTVLLYNRRDPHSGNVMFVVLEDRPEKYHDEPGTLCLIIEGELRGRGPGAIMHIRGIVDCADEVEL